MPETPSPAAPAAATPHLPNLTDHRAPTADDHALVARLKAREPAAFDELVALAGPRLMALARRMLGSEEDARDCVQEAFISAFKALDAFDGRSQLTTWLHRIAVNVCLMRLRSRRRRPERPISELLPAFKDDGHHEIEPRAWKPEPAAGIERRELVAIVRDTIDQLPSGYQEVLLLRDVEGLSIAHTAEQLGLSEAAVKTRLHRARQALRTLLEPHLAEDDA